MRIAFAVVTVVLLIGATWAERVPRQPTDNKALVAPAAVIQKLAPETKSLGPQVAVGEVIVAGIDIEVARKTLQRHGYDEKFGLSLSPGNENIAFETCRIDDNIVLVLAFDKSTKKVTKLSLHFMPDNQTSKAQGIFREILSMTLEKDGIYSVRLKRDVRTSKAAK